MFIFVQLINAMRKKLRVQLAVADLFTAPTIEALATKISLLQILGSPSAANVTASGKTRTANGTYVFAVGPYILEFILLSRSRFD